MQKNSGLNKNNVDLFEISNFYNDRFNKVGPTIKSVGWKNRKDQELRFQQLLRNIELENRTILDFGCGLGDLVPFLQEKRIHFNYIGVDISSNLIEHARKMYSSPNIEFHVGEIEKVIAISKENPIDIILLSGVFSYKTKHIKKYAKDSISKLYDITNECLTMNFLSKYVDYELDKNKHYSPEKMFKHARLISKNVNLYSDYPLYEFTIQLKK